LYKNKKTKKQKTKGEKIMRLEHENDYAKKGVAGTALGLSIGALGVEALRGGLGNLFGGTGCVNAHEAQYTRYDAAKDAEIAALKGAIELRDANTYTDSKLLELYRYVDGKFEGVNAAINAQAVYNATNTATIGCISNQVAQLMALTKTVIPNTSVCPGWGDVTVSVTPATAG
jgi:hypothetical protein